MKQYLSFLILLTTLTTHSCKQAPEPKTIDVTELSITQIHTDFQAGTYTSEDLVKSYLTRIDSVNETINALTYINPDAIAQAKKLDEEFKKTGKLRPLHGIPIIVKDNINTVGMPTTAGALALQHFIPKTDAPIIQKIKEAGAIIIAKSNMAEWAFSPMHTESSTAGITKNPYNLKHVPAGSSGGTAAAVASNLGTIGLGTDTGNSIRGPSSHCALVGFRTTLGLISRSGIVPLYLRNDVVGPMCKTVSDATRLMEVMVGQDQSDPLTAYSEGKTETDYMQYLKEDGLQGVKIGVLRELSEDGVDPEISALFEKAITDLKKLGAIIIDPLEVPDFKNLRQNQWCDSFREDLENFFATYVKSDSMKTLEDVVRAGSLNKFAETGVMESAGFSGRWKNPEIPCLNAYEDQLRVAFRAAIERAMDSAQVEVIIYPTWNNRPAILENFQEEYKGDNNQVIAPHTGQPAFTVPMGYTSGNLPVGIQFLGRMYAEPTLIKISYAYEQGTKHRKPPKTEGL